jgi:putative peptidoglycan lipid II flippase
LSISLAACVNAALLYRGLRRHGAYMPQPGWRPFLLKLLVAVGIMAAFLMFATGDDRHWLDQGGAMRAMKTALLIGGAGTVYFACLFALGFRLADFRRRAA